MSMTLAQYIAMNQDEFMELVRDLISNPLGTMMKLERDRANLYGLSQESAQEIGSEVLDDLGLPDSRSDVDFLAFTGVSQTNGEWDGNNVTTKLYDGEECTGNITERLDAIRIKMLVDASDKIVMKMKVASLLLTSSVDVNPKK